MYIYKYLVDTDNMSQCSKDYADILKRTKQGGGMKRVAGAWPACLQNR